MPVTILPDTGVNNIFVNSDTGRALILTTGPNVLIPDHNALQGIQGGSLYEYYHLTSNEYSNLITGSVVRPEDTGIFASFSYVNEVSGVLQDSIDEINSHTGDYYLNSNPSGYITGINNIVYTIGNQDISGLKDFQTRPTVTDIPVLLSGEAVDLIHLYGKNDEGKTIYKGQPVYINSAAGANPLIKLASNIQESTSSKTIGLISKDLGINEFGYIITEGILENFDTHTAIDGDSMWLGSSGDIIYGTGNRPYGNNHLVYLGVVLRANANNGKVYVKVQNGFEINELHRVYATNPQNNTTLLYDSTSGSWFARQINTGDISGLSNFSLSGHNHNDLYYTESEINSKLANSGQWQEAYSWGDHSLAGYMTGISSDSYVTGEVVRPEDTGIFYTNNNPSGYITGVDLSSYAEISFVTGISGYLDFKITDLENSTGDYYLNSNPSGFITGLDSSLYVTGEVVRPEDTGIFYTNDNPSGFITGVNLSSYATISYTTGISGELQNQITNLDNNTGFYYLNSNPSGYITTGYSNNFTQAQYISGQQIATVIDPVRTTVIGDGLISGFSISGANNLVNPSALLVAVDGALQEPAVDYIVSSGQITFTSPLPLGSKAVVISPVNSLQVSQMIPADGSVTSSKLDNSLFLGGSLQVGTSILVGDNIVTEASDFTLSEESHRGRYTRLTKTGTAQVITIPSVGISKGSEFTFYKATSVALTLSGAGVVNGSGNITSVQNNGAFGLKCISVGLYDFI